MRRRTRREGSHTRPPMTAEVSMWEEVRAGETEAMRDSRTGSSTDSPAGHSGTIPIPRPDHTPMPTITAPDNTSENPAE